MKQNKGYFFSLLIATFLIIAAASVDAKEWPPAQWTESVSPFRIVGPVYYVGSRDLSAYLIADRDCAVLINVGMKENAEMVLNSIKQLGFSPSLIQHILVTQAHFDHAGGVEKLRLETNARVSAGAADVRLLKQGGLNDHVFGDSLPFKPVASVSALSHGEQIECGSLKLTTIATAGHTPGSSSWLLEHNQTTVLFAASVSLLSETKIDDNQLYPSLEQDFEQTFQRLSAVQYDYFLPDHLVFIEPQSADELAPSADWFQRQDVLPKLIERSRSKLIQLKDNPL